MARKAQRQSGDRFRFFDDQTYHFQTLRALNDIPYGGADTSEVLAAIMRIKVGDTDSWYTAWEQTGDRVAEFGRRTQDPISRGRALLRAHNYYRTAEFLLEPHDPRRPVSWKKNIATFYDGLETLGVRCERIVAPYGAHHLNALYFTGPQGSEKLPLIVVCGGFDSTLEELYFVLAAAGLERGYSVLAYEGPGQGSIIREQGVPFTHEWEKPTAAILDEYLRTHAPPAKIVLVGMSMGGFLAPRAAAFDDRIDGVVAFDVFFDFGAISSRSVPPIAFWFERHGLDFFVNGIVKVKAANSPGLQWALQNSMWVMGTRDLLDTAKAFRAYTLRDVAQRIKGDVLILAGEDDHFVPVEQVKQFESTLTQARSVTSVIYDRELGRCGTLSARRPHALACDLLRLAGSKVSAARLSKTLVSMEIAIMKPSGKSWTLSSIILAVAGITLVGAGVYFIVLRPPLLPEDIRYMGLSAADLGAVRPRLEAWLTHVFRVMGGYVLATGVLTITLAATSYRAHHWGAGIGALVGGAASIGWMAVVNFMINSDFKWSLLAMALLWAASLGAFWFENGRQKSFILKPMLANGLNGDGN